MIGHGGFDNKQAVNSDPYDAVTNPGGVKAGKPLSTATIGAAAITVTAGRNVEAYAGLGNGAYAQIGNGGYNHVLNDFTASDITVTAGRRHYL